MSVEEDKVYDINDEDMNYVREDNDLRITSRENSGTGVEWLQPGMEGKSYKSVIKQIKLIMNNDTCMNKKTRNDGIIWGYEWYKYTCIHAGSGERDVYTYAGKERNQSIWWKWYSGDDKVIKTIRWRVNDRKASGYSIKPRWTYICIKEASTRSREHNKGKNGIIKGMTCANRSKQNRYLKEEENVASPMVFLEGLFTTLMIDAYKGI